MSKKHHDCWFSCIFKHLRVQGETFKLGLCGEPRLTYICAEADLIVRLKLKLLCEVVY